MKEGNVISKFTDRFGVNNVQDFIDDVVSDFDNDALYGFIKLK